MRRLLLLILSLIILDVSWALSPTMLELSTHSGEITCDDCSGSLKFAWHMEDNDSTPDVTIGNPCGCSDGDSIGAENKTPIFSAAQKSDGSFSLHINDTDENYKFDSSSYDIVDLRDIKVTFDVYVVSFPSAGTSHVVYTAIDDASNGLSIRLGGTSSNLTVTHTSGGVSEYIWTGAIATGSWLSCEYQAKHNTSGSDHYIVCSGVSSVTEDDDFTSYTGDGNAEVACGDLYGSGAGEYYVDNIKVSVSDRF